MTSGRVISSGGAGISSFSSSSEFLFTWIQSEIESLTKLDCVVKNPLPSTLNSSLCEYLRDGRVLVLLANALDPKSEQATRTLMRNFGNLMTFFSLERVQFFIKWCRDEILLEEKVRFSSAQLIDEANEKVIIECLTALQKKQRPNYISSTTGSSASIGASVSITEEDRTAPSVAVETEEQPKKRSSKLGAFLTQFPDASNTTEEEEAPLARTDSSSTTTEGSILVKKLQIPAAFSRGDYFKAQQEEDATAKKTSPASSPKQLTKSVSKLSIPAAFSSGSSTKQTSPNPKAKTPQKVQDGTQSPTASFASSIRNLTQELDASVSSFFSSPTSVRKLEIPAAFSPNSKPTLAAIDTVEEEDIDDNASPTSAPEPVKKRPSKLAMFLTATGETPTAASLIDGPDMSVEVEYVTSPKVAVSSTSHLIPLETSFDLEYSIDDSAQNPTPTAPGPVNQRPSMLAAFFDSTGGTPTAASLLDDPNMSVEVEDAPMAHSIGISPQPSPASSPIPSPTALANLTSSPVITTSVDTIATVDGTSSSATEPAKKRPSKLAMFLNATGGTPTAASLMDGPGMSLEVEDVLATELSPQLSPIAAALSPREAYSPKHAGTPKKVAATSPKQAGTPKKIISPKAGTPKAGSPQAYNPKAVSPPGTPIDTYAAVEDEKDTSISTSAPEPVNKRKPKLSMFLNTVDTYAANTVSAVSNSHEQVDSEDFHGDSDDHEDDHDGYDVPDTEDEKDVPLLARRESEPPSPSPALFKAPTRVTTTAGSQLSEFVSATEASTTETTPEQSTISSPSASAAASLSPPPPSPRSYLDVVTSPPSSPKARTQPTGSSSPSRLVSLRVNSSPRSSPQGKAKQLSSPPVSPSRNGSHKSLEGPCSKSISRQGSTEFSSSSIPLEEYEQLKQLLAAAEAYKQEMQVQVEALKESNATQAKELESLQLNHKTLEEKNVHLTLQLEQLEAKMSTLETTHESQLAQHTKQMTTLQEEHTKEIAQWKQSKEDLQNEIQRVKDSEEAARYAAQIAFQARDVALAQLENKK